MVDDNFWDHHYWNMHVFLLQHWRSQIKILNIEGGLSGARGGDGGDEVAIDSGEVGVWGGKISIILYKISPNNSAYLFRFLLLRTISEENTDGSYFYGTACCVDL